MVKTLNPAEKLLNVTLPDNWFVESKSAQTSEKGQGYAVFYS